MNRAKRGMALLLSATFFLVFAASGSRAEDHIQLINSGGETGVLVDGKKKNGEAVNDRLYKVPGDDDLAMADLVSVSEVLAFSKERVPVLKDQKQLEAEARPAKVQIQTGEMGQQLQPPSGQIFPIQFTKPIEIELAVWIVTANARSTYQDRANDVKANDCEEATEIWFREAHGLIVRCLEPADLTKRSDRVETDDGTKIPASDYFNGVSFSCSRDAARITKLSYKPGMVNIYYVNEIDPEIPCGGQNCKNVARGVWCDAEPEVIAIAANSFDTTLAHELGHAFLLDHVNELPSCIGTPDPGNPCQFDGTNVMHGDVPFDDRHFLTEGQVFRAFFHPSSALKRVYKKGPGLGLAIERPCPNVSDEKDDEICPLLHLRLWADRLPN